jgi:hypothetical protein
MASIRIGKNWLMLFAVGTIVLSLALVSETGIAQSNSGTVQGTVTDPSKAAVPGVVPEKSALVAVWRS